VTEPTTFSTPSAGTVERVGRDLAVPEPPPPGEPWTAHSLAKGAAGIALFHIESAHLGQGSWRHAHTWIQAAAAGEVSAADNTGLYLGAPAIAFILNAASASSTARYADALATMDRHVAELAHRRATTALTRIRHGELPAFREYDLFYGLTGIGAHLLRRDPGGSALEHILQYLVALTKPLRVNGQSVPGWWVAHDPHGHLSPHYPDGHGNFGAAHGISGCLMLLSQAQRRGVTVDGQHEAITTICAWLDTWRQDGTTGPWWPEHVTLADLRTGTPRQAGPARPSWCYGTLGIARAGQLAALATHDTGRQRAFEDALHRCLADPAQLDQIIDASLCHGWAGVYQTAWRAARDAATPAIGERLPYLAEALARHAETGAPSGSGFLEGDAGTALALITAAQDAAPTSGWDACLLID
jgi:hypothetical protein